MHLAQELAQQAAHAGAAPALVTGAGTTTYAELDLRVRQVAAALRRRGLAPGDRLGLALGSTRSFVEVAYGAWRAGLVVVPLEPGSTPGQLDALLDRCGAAVVVTDAGAATAVADLGTEVLEAQALEAQAHDGEAGGDTGGVPGRSAEPDPAREPEELALLAVTTGTSGRVGAAMLSHASLAANHRQLSATRLGVTAQDTVLGVVPMTSVYGLNVVLTFTLSRGGCVVLAEDRDPAAAAALVARHAVSVVPAVPWLYAAWLEADVEPGAFGSVRVAASGGAPLEPAVGAAFGERFGVAVWQGYGLTEAAGVVTTTALGQDPRPGSVGWPLPGVHVRLRDEHGRPVASGDPGEVQVRGENVFRGYWGDAAATAAAFDADGWLRTGDIGYARDTQLHLVGRRDERIVVRGFSVYPQQVEEVLLAHPAVAEAAVVGGRDDTADEVVTAVVVTAPGSSVTSDELLEHCRGRLAGFKCPREVVHVDALPLTRHGRVLRRDLRPG